MSEPRWIKCSNGPYTCVDEDDYEVLSKYCWTVSPQGYVARTKFLGKKGKKQYSEKVLMHRFILGLKKGNKTYVDHINRDKLDNRRSNLRICDQAKNMCNSERHSKTGYKGVVINNPHLEKPTYTCRVTLYGKTKRICGFKTAEEAALAYNKLALELHGEFARLNEVPQC